jgi:hypothetical protein
MIRTASMPGAVSLSTTPPKQYMPGVAMLRKSKEAKPNVLSSGGNDVQAVPAFKTMYDLMMAACQLLEQRFSNLDQAIADHSILA